MTLKHDKVSGKSNPGDTTIVGGGHWDEDHKFKSSTAGKILAVGSSDAIVDIGPHVYAHYIKTANQDLPLSGVWYEVTFSSSNRIDPWTMYSATYPTRMTLPIAGMYHIFGCLEYDNNATARRDIAFFLNGTADIAYHNQFASPNVNTVITLSTVYSFSANDYIELRARQNAVNGLDLIAGGDAASIRLSCCWIGPLSS